MGGRASLSAIPTDDLEVNILFSKPGSASEPGSFPRQIATSQGSFKKKEADQSLDQPLKVNGMGWKTLNGR